MLVNLNFYPKLIHHLGNMKLGTDLSFVIPDILEFLVIQMLVDLPILTKRN